MRFLIKNITGDPNSPDPRLRDGKKIYAGSENGARFMIIDPQETASVSGKAYEEITTLFADFIQVIDADGTPDVWAPFRKTVDLPAGKWTLVDVGRFSSQLEFHNPGTSLIQWSFSGFISPATAPDPKFVSDLDADETVTFWNAMNPLRYIYFYSATAAKVKILVS